MFISNHYDNLNKVEEKKKPLRTDGLIKVYYTIDKSEEKTKEMQSYIKLIKEYLNNHTMATDNVYANIQWTSLEFIDDICEGNTHILDINDDPDNSYIYLLIDNKCGYNEKDVEHLTGETLYLDDIQARGIKICGYKEEIKIVLKLRPNIDYELEKRQYKLKVDENAKNAFSALTIGREKLIASLPVFWDSFFRPGYEPASIYDIDLENGYITLVFKEHKNKENILKAIYNRTISIANIYPVGDVDNHTMMVNLLLGEQE